MRHLLLLCLAASTALAAALKDPAVVAREWKMEVERSRPPAVQPTLAGQSDALTTTPLGRIFSLDSGKPTSPPLPPASSIGPLYDAPNRPSPRRLPPEVPDNALPWLYRGQEYWLVPLGGPTASR